MQGQGGFREPELPYKDIKPRNQVLSLKLTIEDLQKLQWLVHHDSKAGVLQNTNDKVKGRRVILYLFRNERRAEILDRLYEIRKEYYFNSIKRMKKIYFALRNEDLTTILIEKRRLKRIVEIRSFLMAKPMFGLYQM
jgi:hypothetical protein